MSRRLLILSSLLALTLAAYAPVLSAEFVRWDDRFTLHHNPRLNPPTWTNVAHYWRHGEIGLYMPLTYTVWSGLAWIGHVETADLSGISLNPWVFHATNLIVHLAGVVIVLALLQRLVRNDVAAAIGACVFAMHPVQVEAVAWASGLKDLLAGALALLAIGQFVEWRMETDTRSARRKSRYVLIVTVAILAMLAKASAAMVVPICFAIDVILLRTSPRRAIVALLPMLVPAVALLWIARQVQDVTPIAHTAPPLYVRPFVAGDALAFYLKQLVLPLHLGIDYGRTPQVVLSQRITYAIWIIPIALAGAIAWNWRKHRKLAAAGAIFILALAPVLGQATFQFQQYSTVADHYLYLAMLAPALAIASVLARWPKRAAYAIACVFAIALSVRTFAQARYWKDDFTLLPHAIDVNPRSTAARNNLSLSYEELAGMKSAYAALERNRGDFAAARVHEQTGRQDLERALELLDQVAAIAPPSAEFEQRRADLRRQLAGSSDTTSAPSSPAPATPRS